MASDPVSWWQHAGRAVLQELRDRMRVQFGLHKMEERREKRLRYMDLYSTVHQGHLRWQVAPS